MPSNRTALYDTITVIFLVLTVAMIGIVVLIINDPQSALNPMPPPTVASVIALPSLTPSLTPTATSTATATATATATDTPTATLTFTPTATDTPTPTITPTQVLSGPEGQPTEDLSTATSAPPLDDGSGSPVSGGEPATVPVVVGTATTSPFPFTASEVGYEANQGDEGCQWLSIAGTVAGLNGEPLPGLAIEINGENLRNIVFSGSAARWGEGGFEFNLGAAPRTGTYTLRVLGPTGGPVSEVIYVDTGNTCQRNVAIVEFRQNHSY